MAKGSCADFAAVDWRTENCENQQMDKNDHLTLEQLEKDVWQEPEFHSYLVVNCHQLRKKRLCDFTVEDLRIMIGQEIGLKFLVPKAIEALSKNPFAGGDFYDGDLLVQVLRRDLSALQKNGTSFHKLTNACHAALQSTDPKLSKVDRTLVEGFVEMP